MDLQQYTRFLDNPTQVLGQLGNVMQIRLDGTMTQALPNSVAKTVNHPGSVPLHYRHSLARVVPVTLRCDDTGIADTSAVWVSRRQPATGPFQRDRAYYLQWGSDQAYAIELGFEAQLFFTAKLTGCGILVLTAPGKTIVVHHNVQVPPIPPSGFQRLFESPDARQQRIAAHAAHVRTDSLYQLAQNIIAAHPDITGGKQLSVSHYGSMARVFGVKRAGDWRFFINRPVGGIYRTELLYAQE